MSWSSGRTHAPSHIPPTQSRDSPSPAVEMEMAGVLSVLAAPRGVYCHRALVAPSPLHPHGCQGSAGMKEWEEGGGCWCVAHLYVYSHPPTTAAAGVARAGGGEPDMVTGLQVLRPSRVKG